MICHNISIHICGACTTTMCTVLRFQRIKMPLKSGTLPYSNLNTDNCGLELQANQTTSSRLHLPHHADGCLVGNKVFIKPCCLLPQNVCCAFHGEKLEFTIRTVYRKCSYDNKGPPPHSICTMERSNRAIISRKFTFKSFKKPMKAQFTS